MYYQNWGLTNHKPPDDRERYGVLTTEGGGHWTYVAWREDIYIYMLLRMEDLVYLPYTKQEKVLFAICIKV